MLKTTLDIAHRISELAPKAAELSAIHPKNLGKILTLDDLRPAYEAAQEIIRLEDKLS